MVVAENRGLQPVETICAVKNQQIMVTILLEHQCFSFRIFVSLKYFSTNLGLCAGEKFLVWCRL